MATVTLVTLDFHNTLFRCDDWFRLEVESLPLAVIDLLGPELGNRDIGELKESCRESYRGIRSVAMESGNECDADTSMERVFAEAQLGLDSSRIREAVQCVMWKTVTSARPRCGAVELVETLHRRRIPLAVVSSAAYHPFLEWCLTKYGMRDAFGHVVTSASCGIYKSDPCIYQHALDLFACPADSAVHIGDSHRFDVSSASQVGMRTILLTPDVYGEFDPQPDAVIESLGEAEPHLDRLLQG